MHSFVENNSWVYSLPCKNSVPSLHQVLNLTRDRTCADTSPGSFHLSLVAFSSWKHNLYSLSRYWSAKSHEKIAPISSCWWVSKGKITQSVSSQSWGNHCHWIALGSLRHPTKRRERLLRFPAQKQKRPLAERWWQWYLPSGAPWRPSGRTGSDSWLGSRVGCQLTGKR